jgi:hypothetical protein
MEAYHPQSGVGVSCAVDDDCPGALVCYKVSSVLKWSKESVNYCGCSTQFGVLGDTCMEATTSTLLQQIALGLQCFGSIGLCALSGFILLRRMRSGKVRHGKEQACNSLVVSLLLIAISSVFNIARTGLSLWQSIHPERYATEPTTKMKLQLGAVATFYLLLLSILFLAGSTLNLAFSWIGVAQKSNTMSSRGMLLNHIRIFLIALEREYERCSRKRT